MNEQKSIQYFVLVSGCFVPIVDDRVRHGAYLVDVDRVGDAAYNALGLLGAAYIVGIDDLSGSRLGLPVEKCSDFLLRVESSFEGDLEVSLW